MRICVVAALVLVSGCLPKEKKPLDLKIDDEEVRREIPRAFLPVGGDDLEDPLLRDGKTAMAKPATFHARGRDDWDTEFQGYLVVETSPEAFMRVGYLEWGSDHGAGRHYFDGAFDEATRKVRWSGFKVERHEGRQVCAVYTATLSADGRTLQNGKWTGGIGIPGTWVAEKTGE